MKIVMNRAAALSAALFLSAASSAGWAAAPLAVNPITLRLPAGALATSLNLTNKGDAPVTMQAQLFEWTQDGTTDVLKSTRDLLVSPPIFRIAPGATQVVRIGRLKPGTELSTERAYRLEVLEVPPADRDTRQVATVLKLSLPVFVPAERPQSPDLAWSAIAAPGGALNLRFENRGNSSAKLSRLELILDGQVVAKRDVNLYVLAGAARTFSWHAALPGAKAGALSLRITHYGKARDLPALPYVPAPEPTPEPTPESPAPAATAPQSPSAEPAAPASAPADSPTSPP